MDNVKQVVPSLLVMDMERSLRYYLDGLGFVMKNKWVVEGKIRWCWLELGDAALMLQLFHKPPENTLGEGVALWFQCEDAIALYNEFISRGVTASEPQVSNGLWDTRLSDPDGYWLHFESPADAPEETKLSEWNRKETQGVP
jgi:lactoylglutathione lyase